MIEITEALLVELAGPGAYERGVGYFADSRVTSIKSDGQRTFATVLGTYPYNVELTRSEQRLDRALEQVDDSGGFRYRTQELLCELHKTALRGLDWSPERCAVHLLDLALADTGDQFAGVPDFYAPVLGDDGLAAFYAEIEARLDALPILRPGASFERRYPYLQLSSYLKDQAAQTADWDALIALEQRTATNQRDYRRIAELYLRNQDPSAAATWLTKADAFDTDDRNAGTALWVTVHAASGDWDAAADAQRRVFSREPSYAGYCHLLDLASRAGRAKETREEIKDWLRAPARLPYWRSSTHAYVLAQILRDEEDWEGSCEAMLLHVDHPNRLLEAARWLAEPAPASACDIFSKAIEALIGLKKNRAYRDAIRSLKEAKPAFDAVSTTALAGFVSQLRETHKRKRNLMVLLDELPWA